LCESKGCRLGCLPPWRNGECCGDDLLDGLFCRRLGRGSLHPQVLGVEARQHAADGIVLNAPGVDLDQNCRQSVDQRQHDRRKVRANNIIARIRHDASSYCRMSTNRA
jgi:hypothetical protein